jgi:hypothetical protein
VPAPPPNYNQEQPTMFVRKLILLCSTLAILAPLASAKPPKAQKQHKIYSNKVKKGPKAKWGKHKVKNKHA